MIRYGARRQRAIESGDNLSLQSQAINDMRILPMESPLGAEGRVMLSINYNHLIISIDLDSK